jgi:hypothetical protein
MPPTLDPNMAAQNAAQQKAILAENIKTLMSQGMSQAQAIAQASGQMNPGGGGMIGAAQNAPANVPAVSMAPAAAAIQPTSQTGNNIPTAGQAPAAAAAGMSGLGMASQTTGSAPNGATDPALAATMAAASGNQAGAAYNQATAPQGMYGSYDSNNVWQQGASDTTPPPPSPQTPPGFVPPVGSAMAADQAWYSSPANVSGFTPGGSTPAGGNPLAAPTGGVGSPLEQQVANRMPNQQQQPPTV